MGRKRKDSKEQLRKEAEARLARSPEEYRLSLEGEDDRDIHRILYDLRTHQMELQIQNEELQEAYIELERARDNYYHLYNFAPVSYLTIAKDTRVLEANQRSFELLGTGGPSLLGQFLSSYVLDEDLPFLLGGLKDVFMLLQKRTFDIRMKRKSGRVIYVRVEGALAGDAPDKCRLALTDITELKKTQEELRQVNLALERRVHERTAQIGELSTQLCRAEQKERKRLSLMLHDHLQQLLVASRFTMGRLQPQMDPEEFGRLLGQSEKLLVEAIESSRSLAVELSPPVLYDAGLAAALQWLTRWAKEKYNMTVHLKISKKGTEAAEELNMFLFQAAKELLLNIVKHSGVTEAFLTLSAYDEEHFSITLEDHGAGFNPEEVMSVDKESVGVGLRHTARRLEMMGGRLEIKSAPGKGSSFSLIAPVKKSGEVGPAIVPYAQEEAAVKQHLREAAPGPKKHRERKIRAIVADDHAMMRQGLLGVLKASPGIEVVGEARDGLEAIQMARQLHPDIVIMDINMPKVNGIEATRLIKEEMPGIQVLVLSLYNEEDMATASRLAGASSFVSKSEPAETLIGAIREAAG